MSPFITRQLFTAEFLILCAASLLFFASNHMLTPVLPLYFQEQHFNGLAIGSLMAAFMVASLLVRPYVGKLSDEVNRKKLMLAGISLFAVCPAFYLLTLDETLLYVVRILHGIGFAIFYTASMSHLVFSLPPNHKAEGLSYYSNAIKVAMAFSPGLGLYLATHHQMSWPFWLAMLIGLGATGCVLALKNPETPATTQIKPKGKLFNAKAAFPGLVMSTNSLVFGALIPYVPLLAQEKGLEVASLFYTCYAVFLIASRFLTGRVSDMVGREWVILPGMSMVIATLVLMSQSANDILFLVSASLYGLAAGTVQPSLMAIAADRTEPQERGSAMATFTLLNDSGIALGTFAMGLLGSLIGYGPSLLWVAGVVTCGLVLYLMSLSPRTLWRRA